MTELEIRDYAVFILSYIQKISYEIRIKLNNAYTRLLRRGYAIVEKGGKK